MSALNKDFKSHQGIGLVATVTYLSKVLYFKILVSSQADSHIITSERRISFSIDINVSVVELNF